MAFSPQFLDELRARLAVADIVGKRVKLVKRGHEYVGLCPFHNEKTPSFTVNEDKGFYHCFGCGAHGDVIGFAMQSDGLSFPEAVERLAGQAGLAIPASSPEEHARAREATTLRDVNEAAAAWFEAQLRGDGGRAARDYLAGRGIDETTMARFRIGFAPDSRVALKRALRGDGADENRLVAAGLLVRPEDGRDSYDRFRRRIVFPITDRRGRVIAFGGRILGEGQPKYLNSPDTPLFHKGRVLYGAATARAAAQETGEVVVVEGYTDVIALYRAGFANAVAPLGTALTEVQIGELWRLAPRAVICFDGDAAGRRAAARAAERAMAVLKPGFHLDFLELPAGEDPGSLVETRGREGVQEALAGKQPLVETIWRIETAGRDASTPESRADLERRLDGWSGAVGDSGVRQHYRQFFRARMRDAFGYGHRRNPNRNPNHSPNRNPNHKRKTAEPEAQARPVGASGPGGAERLMARAEQVLLAVILNHPELLDECAEEVAVLALGDASLDKLRHEILKVCQGACDLDAEGVRRHLKEHGFSTVLDDLLGSEIYLHAPFARADAPIEAARLGWTHALNRLRARDFGGELTAAERAFSEAPTDENWGRLAALREAISASDGASDEEERYRDALGRM